MMPRRNIVTVAVACLGSLLIVAGTLFFLWTQTPIDPTDLLPADRTVAYFSNVGRDDVAQWNSAYPILSHIPYPNGTFDLALINEKGAFQWMMFSDAKSEPTQRGIAYGNLRIEDSYGDNGLSGRLETGKASPLSHSAVLRTLRANSPKSDTWAFVDLKGVLPASPTPLDRYLSSVIREHPQLILSMDAKRWSASLLAPSDVSGVPSLELPHGSYPFSVTIAHPSEFFRSFLGRLQPAEADIARSFAQGFVSDLTTKTVTLERDIAPLFKEPMTLSFQGRSTGPVAFLLEGHMADQAALGKLLTTVYDKLSMSVNGVSVAHRQFDPTFSTTVVERTANTATTTSSERNGWTVRLTSSTDGKRAFFVAQKGNEFLITNESQWMTDHTAATQRVPAGGFDPGLSDSDLLAAGHTDTNSIRWFLAQMPILGLESNLFPFLNTLARPLDWSVVRRGNVVTLSVLR